MPNIAPDALSQLRELASQVLGAEPADGEPLLGGGSDRRYFRFSANGTSVVGAISAHAAELRAFLAFSRHFAARGIPVPAIHASDEARGLYLMEDLGPLTLRNHLLALRTEPGGSALADQALESVVRWLPVIQVKGGAGLDYRLCVADPVMGRETYEGDIQLFLKHFAARFAPSVDPAPVAAALEALIARMAALDTTCFCYRDFQTRNIMWCKGGPVFIDYQSGRRGPLVYDLASILYSPDSGLDEPSRERMISAYLDALAGCGQATDPDRFRDAFYPMVLLRRLQALGAYARIAKEKGLVGFLKLIPSSIDTLCALAESGKLGRSDCAEIRDWLHLVFDAARNNPDRPQAGA